MPKIDGQNRHIKEKNESGSRDKSGARVNQDQYFTRRPVSESQPLYIDYMLPRVAGDRARQADRSHPDAISHPADRARHADRSKPDAIPRPTNAQVLSFITDSGVFSGRRVDFGTDLLIRSVPPISGKALDLGCGYGAAGIALSALNPGADFWFADINERAVGLCRENCARLLPDRFPGMQNARIFCSDGFEAFESETFDVIVMNPPIRSGKANVYNLYRQSNARLSPGGALYIVIQKKQGMDSTFRELADIFGNCGDIARKAGYHILFSRKK